jgi:hypothetical protein
MDRATHSVSEPRRPLARSIGRPFGLPRRPTGQTTASHGHGGTQGPWQDDLLGDSWSWPPEDEIDEGATIAEIEALLGELVAELEG